MNGQKLYSIGFAACKLRMDVARLEAVFRSLRHTPRVTINDCPHYDARQLVDAELYLARQQQTTE